MSNSIRSTELHARDADRVARLGDQEILLRTQCDTQAISRVIQQTLENKYATIAMSTAYQKQVRLPVSMCKRVRTPPLIQEQAEHAKHSGLHSIPATVIQREELNIWRLEVELTALHLQRMQLPAEYPDSDVEEISSNDLIEESETESDN
ncbi:hypothetical protein BOTBODRAFT_178864 [Botryobasidium botryosum FD-172 SS1]|uniref:Uncharacterized protein n=1 Tax=Botryobasidium botryosum (strain FD-172 SS1) TaxID=930990 RepID=A0A067M4K6_BOTB1|nr:hypothetical protein BOTBODRAFT_178864 [Botryobasidium botryosum FD-172 SS1]